MNEPGSSEKTGFWTTALRWSGFATVFVALLGLSFALDATPAFGQMTITGQVTDTQGAPLVGVEVFVQRAQVGTVTDANGRYTLVVPESRIFGGIGEITARALGYQAARLDLEMESGETTKNFTLRLDPLRVEAIVAVGQGMQQRREALGATINTVTGEELNETQQTNLVAALAGKAPNVEVTSSSGEPGAGAYIRIRGANSLLGGTQPLFIVDGVPVSNTTAGVESSVAGTVETNRAADINPEDIESIEILKGAAASGIYGSRGANGVIVITTKRGRAGETRVTLKSAATWDEVTELQPLQRSFGRGLADPANPTVDLSPTTSVTWGEPLGSTPTFDHAGEIYQTGHTYDTDLQISGGSDRTTYFMSLSRTDQDGVIVGNSEYEKTTVRLKGTQDIRDDMSIAGNFAYTQSGGDFIQKGSNISGIQLGMLRTPPEFNNLPYLDPETGLHRSYRCNTLPCVGSFGGRGYDNPFWIAHEMPNTSEVGRVFGNVEAEYQPFQWLTVNYNVGSDYWSDERLSLFPKTSSDFPQGRVIRADLHEWIIDSNLLATVSRDLTEDITGSVSFGQNLNHSEFRRYQVNGFQQILGTDQLDFSINREPNEYREEIRTDGLFVQANVELWDQLFLNGGARGDKSSTFGEEKRYWFPNVTAAWEFTASPVFARLTGAGEAQDGGALSWLNFGKVRAAYGEAGTPPPVFSNVSSFTTFTITDGWLSPNGLNTIYAGFDGVGSQATLGNPDIRPEVSNEYEIGLELAMLDNRLALDVVWYEKNTEDAIITLPVPPSTGFFTRYANGVEFENQGWEVRLDARPLQGSDFSWDVSAQWARNESCVTELLEAEAFGLNGFTGSAVEVVRPDDVNGDGIPDEEGCHPFGVFRSDDFIKVGNGYTVDGVDIDAAHPGQDGAIYLAADGLPRYDAQLRPTADPNPRWTGSLRNTVTLFNKVRVSALLDVVHDQQMWNGTKGALFFFGTHGHTENCHGAGCSYPSFADYYDDVFDNTGMDIRFVGPGVGVPVTLDWNNWFVGGLGSGFTGPSTQFVEDNSFVKLRDVSVSYTIDHETVQEFGFSTIDLKVSGRNLKTWTDYTGIDPEANLTDQSSGRGLDYFNNPQTRSWVFTVQFNR